jgi:hexosaminidase
LRLDLSQPVNIGRVTLRWEAAYGKSFQIQVSSDDANWTTVYTTTTGAGGVNDITFPQTNKRFVRVLCQQRGTLYAYSLYEFEAYAN